MNPTLTDVMPYHPAVFAIGEVYQILIPLAEEAILRVEVGERRFYDDMCGVLRSSDLIHRVEVPMSGLDAAKEYTVVYQKIVDRKAYFPEMEEAVRLRPSSNTMIRSAWLMEAVRWETMKIVGFSGRLRRALRRAASVA